MDFRFWNLDLLILDLLILEFGFVDFRFQILEFGLEIGARELNESIRQYLSL